MKSTKSVDFSKLVVKITSLAKSEENDNSKSKLNNDLYSKTKIDEPRDFCYC